MLSKYLGWSDSVGTFVTRMVCGLFLRNGIWLIKIAQASSCDKAKVTSDVRRLQRFLNDIHIAEHDFSLMLYHMLQWHGKITVILDRTNWKFGKSHINVFVACLLYRLPDGTSFAVPIAWDVYAKAGTSHTRERIALMKRVFAIVGGKENIECVLGDREFIGDAWVSFLAQNKVPFILRMRSNMYVVHDGKLVQISTLVSSVTSQEQKSFVVTLQNLVVHLVATRSNEGELVVVIASMDITGNPLDAYRLRWLIELFFKSIKSKGFDLEKTHITKPDKIKKLFALIALATVCAVKMGAIKHSYIKKITIKKHGRRLNSLFTYGIDFINAIFRGESFQFDPNLLCDAVALMDGLFSDYFPQLEKPDYPLGIG